MASHQHRVVNCCCEVCPFTVFIQRMEFDQRVIIRFLCKESVSPEDIHTCLERQFGDATYSEQNVRRRFQYVWQERKDMHDELRSGRPPIDFLDIQILALLDEQPFHSAYLVAQSLGISHLTILNHLRESLGMKNVHLDWIPHELTTGLRQNLMETCRELLPILKAREKK